jgi:RHS repeat-associated protein
MYKYYNILRLTGLMLLLTATCSSQRPMPAAYNSSVNVNYIRTWDVKVPVMDVNTLQISTSIDTANIATKYIDGLGRDLQTVQKRFTPQGYDLVSPIYYDDGGRVTYSFLFFASRVVNGSEITNDGSFKMNPFQQDSVFSKSQFTGDTYYYSQTNYEASSLNRPVISFSAGNSWIGAGKGVGNQYLVSQSSDSVRVWLIDTTVGSIPTSAATYNTGELFKNVVADEDGHQVIEFTDREKKLILKKVQLSNSPANGHSGWSNTYYVYDDLDNLRFVIQPNAVQWLMANSWNFSAGGGSNVADELCFRYEYDGRKRLIVKKVPGAGESYMVYDSRDRPVFTQDANQRLQNQWLSTQYDGLNRPVITGLMTFSSTRDALQQSATILSSSGGGGAAIPVSLDLSAADESGISQASQQIILDTGFSTLDGVSFLAEIVNGNYTNSGYGAEGLTVNNNAVPAGVAIQPLIINYYDNYDWVTGASPSLGTTLSTDHTTDVNYFITSFNTSPFYAAPVLANGQTRGQQTGAMHLVLGENRPLYSVDFYDDRARLIQSRSMNYTGGVDTATNQYDFSGKTLRNLLTHFKAGHTAQSHKVLTKMNYDARFRIKSIWKNIDDATADQLIDSMQYNELGQLSAKYVGNGLDNLIFDYNIRGWTTGINKDYVGGTVDHYFGMELSYDKATSVTGTSYANPLFNGNIAGTIWKSAGDNVNRKYDFTYDNMNRLMGATYLDNHSGGWDSSAMNYTVSNLNYDANGNILTMNQNGFKVGSPSAPVDQLVYTYKPNSNKLTQVNDGANDSLSLLGDFHYKGVKQAYDYTYDVNGNLLQDNNKAIDHITYNFLNLPQQVHVNGKGNITYTYDAGGNKLQKVTTDSMSRHSTTTLYLGGFVYQQADTITNSGGGADTLQFVGHEEGRARWASHKYLNGSTAYGWEYDFYERDHLGNTRILLSQERDTAHYMATMEATYRSTEDALFYNIGTTSYPTSAIPGGYPADNTTTPNDSVAVVNGNGNKMGPALLLKVMSGDSVVLGVKSFYQSGGTVGGPNSSLSDVLSSLASGLISVTGGTHGGLADLNNTSGSPVFQALKDFMPANDPATTGKPKAYLNWMLLDNQFNYVTGNNQSGAVPVGAADSLIPLATTIKLHKSGFLYIWVSNETPGWNVFFDNMCAQTFSGPMVEENHYYPFGLTMAGISDKALKSSYAENKYRFVGQLYDDDLGWDTYQFKFRTQDPQLGRFWQIDPLASKYAYNSTYAYAENRPIDGIDLEGKEFLRAVGELATGNVFGAGTAFAEWYLNTKASTNEAMAASGRLATNTSERSSTPGDGAVQRIEASINKMSDQAAAAQPALTVLDATATLASFTPVTEAGLPAAMFSSGASFGSRVSIAENFSLTGASTSLAQKVVNTASNMQSAGQFPATIVGGITPTGESLIGASGTVPYVVAPSLSAAAETVGGVGARNAGNVVGCCSEFRVANELMLKNPSLSPTDIKFTPAIRPRTMEIIPPCENCKTIFKTK